MKVTLTAETRDLAHRSEIKTLRADRKIPAVVYGPEMKPVSITVAYNPFVKALADAGESTLVEVDVAGAKHNVLIKDTQTDPATGRFTHVDFYAVSMKKELETDVTLEFIGESEAVKSGGTLVKVKDALSVRCLPKDLVRSIEVSIERLKTYDDVITVADVQLPSGLTVLAESEDVIAKVSAPLTEDQLKALEAENAADVSKVEVVGKKEEAAADGEAAAEEKSKE